MNNSRTARRIGLLAVAALTASVTAGLAHPTAASAATTYPYTLNSSQVGVGFASDGSVQSLKVTDDKFDTQYVMNPDVAPDQGNETNTKYKQWLGNVMFSYALGDGTVSASGVGSNPWQKAWTTESADGRSVSSDGSSVDVDYANSTAPEGIKNFSLKEGYSVAADGSLTWTQTVTNTSGQDLTIGDWGVPLPTNELWKGGDSIYETRVLSHSYVGRNGSYVTIGRPSGQGPYLMLSTDDATDTGFEYQDRWRTQEVGDTSWAWNSSNEGSNIRGLNVYYVHSEAIQSTNRGYLGSTALTLADGASKTYTFHVNKVTDNDDVKQTLYDEGNLDTTVVPGMVVPYDQTAQIALRVKGTITSVDAKNENDSDATDPTDPVATFDHTNGDYQIYKLAFDKTELGNDQVTVHYTDAGGEARESVLQFDVTDSASDAISAHAKFMVDHMQWTTADGITADDIRNDTYDDWLMNAADGKVPSASDPPAGKRNSYAAYGGLGDDWGLPHGDFLAAKEVALPVKDEVQSLDNYLETAVWEHLMGNTADDTDPSYLIHDFWEQGKPGALNDTPTYRGYAYPHIYNTFFSMYEVEKQNPNLIAYAHSAKWYLNVAYQILKELYDGPVAYNYNTGLMGELTTPAIIAALQTEGMTAAANDVIAKMATKYANFEGETYPYGSEYSYDNTGEEAVYTLAKMNVNNDQSNALRMMRDIVLKTQAARGQMPVWYWYADPTTITGDNWWQFQYSTALAGYTIDDYINHTSALETGDNAFSDTDRAELERLNYAAKTALLASVNSGQISTDPANIGASAWTYQSEKGNLGTSGLGGGDTVSPLNGWRGMTGESDLGLWGILQTLSADVVTDDPIFGTVGYGATVTQGTDSTTVVPTDGLQRRLNMTTQQLSVSLNNDRYTKAVVSKANDDVALTLDNVTGEAHSGSLDVTGLKQGTYSVIVNGVAQSKVNFYTAPSASGDLAAPVVANYSVPAGSSYTVQLSPTTPDANTAPVVNAGADQTGLAFGLDPITLSGSATDDGLGNPNGTLTTTWSVLSAPTGASATFSDATSLSPTVTVSAPGTYIFRLTGSDGDLSSSDDVSVTVDPLAAMPKDWVDYDFDSASNGTVADQSGDGNDLTLKGTAAPAADGSDTVLSLDGTDGAYAQLPNDILSRSKSLTVSSWVKVNKLVTFTRIFDFGSSTQKYFFLTPALGNGNLGVAVTKAGNGQESQITTNYTVPTGTWQFVRVTITPNTDGSTYTGTIYVNGTQVGQNTAMAVAPKDLGRTSNDYLGKSQFSDPYLNGELDDFSIKGDVEDTSPAVTAASITGDAYVGSTLTATTTVNQPGASVAYQWLRNGTAISGATSGTYTTTAADAGTSLTFAALATKHGYAGASTTSAAKAVTRAPVLTVSSSKVTSGTKVTVIGKNFAPSSTARITLDSGTAALATVRTSSTSTFTTTITVPVTAGKGAHTLRATVGPVSATASLTVRSSVTTSARSVASGGTVTVTGHSFAPKSAVTITLDAGRTVLGRATTDANGGFRTTFTVPTTVAGGAHQVVATVAGSSVRTALTVRAVVHLSTRSARAGKKITVTGTGFGARQTVWITLDGKTRLATVKTGAGGSFRVVVAIPSSTSHRKHTIVTAVPGPSASISVKVN